MIVVSPFLILLTLVVGSHAWSLYSNANHVTPGETQNVEIECKMGNTQDKSVDVIELEKTTRIIITKIGLYGVKSILAKVRLSDNLSVISKETDDFNVTGHVGRLEGTFVKVTWPIATANTPGAYVCNVIGYDKTNEFETINVEPIIIKERVLTLQDVNNAIEKATVGLKAEVARLTTFIESDMKELKREIQDRNTEMKSEITLLKNNFKLEYASKAALSLQSSVLMNFTRTEITNKNESDKREHNEILQRIQDLNNTMDREMLSVKSQISHIKNKSDTNTFSLEQNHIIAMENISMELNRLKAENNDFVRKYNKGIANLRIELTKRISSTKCRICPTPTTASTTAITTTPTTTTPTTPEPPKHWPGGYFALQRVKTIRGCPTHSSFKNSDYIYPNNDDDIRQMIVTGYKTESVGYCIHVATSQTTPVWPEGSYCIVQMNGKNCPKGFQSGHINLKTTNKNIWFGNTKIMTLNYYCCRSDGSPKAPIRLPTENAFNLLRYKGRCQQVENMKASNSSIHRAQRANTIVTLSEVEKKGSLPDSNIYDGGISVLMCRYS